MTGSVVVRRSIGRQLKALRTAAGKTSGDVTAAGIASKPKLARIENGQGHIRVPDVRALCWLFGADPVTTEKLVGMALNAAEEGWWEEYSDVMPAWFGVYIELEAAASRVQVFDATAVYGILQTLDYRRALLAREPGVTEDERARRLSLHQQRQRAAFDRDPPLQVTAVLDEGVLRREVGGRGVMAAQITALRGYAQQPHVEIFVLPWGAGAHRGTKGPMAILGYHDEGVPDVVYLETYTGARYVEQETTVETCHDMFAALRDMSIPIEEHLNEH